MGALGRWCFRHRYVVIGAWLLVFIALGVASQVVGSSFSDKFTLPGTQSSKATALLSTQVHGSSGDSDTIVLHAKTGQVGTSANEANVTTMLAQVAQVPQVGAVVSPFTTQGASQVSANGQTAYATVTFTQQSQSLATANIQKVVDLGSALRSNTLQVEFGGSAIGKLDKSTTSTSELIGIVAAAVVMLVAFASLLAAVIPLIAAILALGSAIFTLDLLTHVMTIGTIAPIIAALVGLGVGIDYALFVVTRHRNGIRAGLSPEEAAVTAMDTSGRAVVFAGGTVVVAMLGLLILDVSFLSGIGIAAAIMVAFAVSVAATLLPALFGAFGMKVLSRRQRAQLARNGPSDINASGAWARWAGFVQKRPIPLVIIATGVMALLIIPFFSLRLGSSDAGNNQTTTTTRKAYDLLADGFGPGSNGPLQLVAKVPSTQAATDFVNLATAIRNVKGVALVQAGPVEAGSTVRTMQVTPTTSPESKQTSTLIDTLRNRVIPGYENDGLTVYVGGQTAVYKDFASVLTSKLPEFIAIIVILGGLLLMLAFRSLVVPLTAAVMNLISAGASFGIVVAVFQWGWGSATLGAGTAGPIESFLPAIMLSILFGLSMDYEVFLVSRIHEEWLHTSDNKLAVKRGQAASGRVITAAAIIMICVFMAFVLGGQRIIAEFGVGLASAILLDALVVRTILVPAVMQLFGKWNWYLPKSIDRVLPHFSVEGPAEAPIADEPELSAAGRR
jgi:putative drug exporter of the RND superfamily